MRVLLLLLLLFSPLAWADGTASIFNIPNYDQSILFLSELFGQVGNVIGGATNGPLERVILLFNNVALVIGGAIIIYAIGVSTINTAHDGEMLGKKWNSVWIPLRAAIGFALLLPVKAGGYAIVQVIIMWVVVQGIGAADYVWAQYIKNVEAGNATPQQPYVSASTMQGITEIFRVASCAYTVANTENANSSGQANSPVTPSFVYNSPYSITIGTAKANSGNDDSGNDDSGNFTCGTINLQGYKSYSSGTLKSYSQDYHANTNPPGVLRANGPIGMGVQAGSDIFNFVNSFSNAKFLQEMDDFYGNERIRYQDQVTVNTTQQLQATANYYVNSTNYCNNNLNLDCISDVQRQIMNIAQDYASQMVGASAPVMKSQFFSGLGHNAMNPENNESSPGIVKGVRQIFSSSASAAVESDLDQATQYGWLYAGAYYILLTKTTSENSPTVYAPSIQAPSPNTNSLPSDYIIPYSLVKNMTTLCPSDGQPHSTAGSSIPCIPSKITVGGPSSTYNITYVAPNGTGAVLSDLLGDVNRFIEDIFWQFIHLLTSTSSNPVIALASLGQGIVVAATSLFLVIGAVVIAVSAGTGWIPLVGNDITASIQIAELITNIPLFATLGIVIGGAAVIGYYVPLMPYVLFTAGALAWFILVIEAMVAGPILALGIIHPEGSHDVWGRSEKGIMLLVNIFLRPLLMIIGFVAASLLVYIVFQMINGGFLVAISSLGMTVFGPLTAIFSALVYFGISVYLIQQCFKLIHKLPDQVMRWIGEAPEQSGQEADQLANESKQDMSEKAKGAHGGAAKAMADKKERNASAKTHAETLGALQQKANQDNAERRENDNNNSNFTGN